MIYGFFPALLLLAALGCGDASDRAATDAGGNSYPLVGEWQGSVSTSTGSADLLNAKAELNISAAAQAGSGTFKLGLVGIEGATAFGSFQDFMGRSLHLTLAESAISKLGQKGDTVVLDYNHAGNSLLLSNKNVEFQLIRTAAQQPGGAPDGGQGGGGAGSGHALVGYWNCLDELGFRWTFHVKNTSEFWLEITSADRSPQWSTGRVQIVGETAISLIVDKSNVDTFKGTKIDLLAASATVADVEIRDGEELQRAFRCAKP